MATYTLRHRDAVIEDRFLASFTVGDECFEWQAALNTAGYGRFRTDDGKVWLAHRYAWEQAHGPIEDGLVIDHLCRNRRCVKTTHLEPVTQVENLKRGWAAQTHCRRAGHEFTPENTIQNSSGRQCRTCKNERDREYLARRRQDKEI